MNKSNTYVLFLVFLIIVCSIPAFLFAQEKEIILLKGHNHDVYSIAFSPNNDFLVSGSRDNTIKLWNLDSGVEVSTFSGYDRGVTSVVYSHNGKFILTGGENRKGNALKIWSVDNGTNVHDFPTEGAAVFSIALSPDGSQIITGETDNKLRLWDISTRRELKSFVGHERPIKSLSFSPTGNAILSGDYGGEVKLWDIATGNEIQSYEGLRLNDRANSISFSPDGRYFLVGSSGGWFKLAAVSSGEVLNTFSGHVGDVNVVFSSDGSFAVSAGAGGTIKIWDVFNNELIHSFKGHGGRGLNGITDIDISKNDRLLASANQDKTIKIWSIGSAIISWSDSTFIEKVKSSETELFAERDQFEIMEEFQKRMHEADQYLIEKIDIALNELKNKIRKSRKETSLDFDLGTYDVDRNLYPVTIEGNTEWIPMELEDARTFFEYKNQIKVKAIQQLKLNLKEQEMVNIKVIHPIKDKIFLFGRQIN